jgi:hypothetical protein
MADTSNQSVPVAWPLNRGSDPTKWVQKADETHRELERHGWSDEVGMGAPGFFGAWWP